MEQPIISFESSQSFLLWLSKNHNKSNGIWLRFFKKDSKIPTVTYSEALEEALCFGWIDGQRKKYDAKSFLQRFTPRRTRSLWSKRNTLIVKRLIKEKRMKEAGFKEITKAKKDGRWARAYSSSKNMTFPKEFLVKLKQNHIALSAFKVLSKSQKYYIAFQLQTAKKEETKEKRIVKFIKQLSKK